MILSALPDRRAATAPHAPAVADGSVNLDNSEFLVEVQRAAASLRTAGVSAGDVVAVMLPDTATLVVSMFATWRLGATVTLVDPLSSAVEIGSRREDAGAKVLITAQPWAAAPAAPDVIHADELTRTDPDITGPKPSNGVPALITRTGSDEGIRLAPGDLDALSRFLVEVFALTDTDHNLVALSSSRINGIVVGVLSPLLAGGSVTMAGAVSPSMIFDQLQRSDATYFSAEPAMYTALSTLPGRTRPKTSSVRFAICCEAPASADLRTTFERRYGIPIVNGHGLKKVYDRVRLPYPPATETCTP